MDLGSPDRPMVVSTATAASREPLRAPKSTVWGLALGSFHKKAQKTAGKKFWLFPVVGPKRGPKTGRRKVPVVSRGTMAFWPSGWLAWGSAENQVEQKILLVSIRILHTCINAKSSLPENNAVLKLYIGFPRAQIGTFFPLRLLSVCAMSIK